MDLTSVKNALEYLLIGRASENFQCIGNGFTTAQVEIFLVSNRFINREEKYRLFGRTGTNVGSPKIGKFSSFEKIR